MSKVARVLSMVEVLSGHVVHGMSNAELAQATGCTPSQVTRDMQELIRHGWAEQTQQGRFRVKATFGRLSLRVLADIDAAENRLSNLRRNYTQTQ